MTRSYGSPESFKQALEQHLRSSGARGGELARKRQLVVFERFLARVSIVLGDNATLKGGLVIELRLKRARTTKDIDLQLSADAHTVLAGLHELGRMNLGDFMTFDVATDREHPTIHNDGMRYEGQRFRAECRIGGKLYAQPFGVDIAFGDSVLGDPDRVIVSNALSFAGLAPSTIRIYPVATHIAEKLHAYTLPRPRVNSRVKDLPDIALLASVQALDAVHLRNALKMTFATRNTHELPSKIPYPPVEWTPVYAAMAQENGLPWGTIDEVIEAARGFLDPVLGGEMNGAWEPTTWTWSSSLKPRQ